MKNSDIQNKFTHINTPQIADACIRLEIEYLLAPPGIKAVKEGTKLAGKVRPVKHFGSVDVFFEAMLLADEGDVLVIDNEGRWDEGCIGDLTALEAQGSGLSGMIVWGYHRDTQDLINIGFPVFSYGSCPSGPLRNDERSDDTLEVAEFGDHFINAEHVVFADADGVIFTDYSRVEEILNVAEEILNTERKQASAMTEGNLLKDQLKFKEYLEKRKNDQEYTLRKHLRIIGGAIEE